MNVVPVMLLLGCKPHRYANLHLHSRRALHQRRRRKTAKALHALRYDREYLLGQLPPIVSAQVRAAGILVRQSTCKEVMKIVQPAITLP